MALPGATHVLSLKKVFSTWLGSFPQRKFAVTPDASTKIVPFFLFTFALHFTKASGGRRFLVVDGAMNDLLRPALYGAFHPVAPVSPMHSAEHRYDVVGPVCETSDFLALDRLLPALEPGDLLAVFAAGAYGASMGSNYNTRRRPGEVLVSGNQLSTIRRRETFEELWAQEMDL